MRRATRRFETGHSTRHLIGDTKPSGLIVATEQLTSSRTRSAVLRITQTGLLALFLTANSLTRRTAAGLPSTENG